MRPTKRRRLPLLVLPAVVLTAVGLGGSVGATPAAADVEDFHYSDLDVGITLGTTDDGRATAEVVEDWTAVFPETDQNRGIVRGLPQSYKGAPLNTSDIEVTDGEGTEVPFEVDDQEGADEQEYTVLTIDDDTFKHGATRYVISYRMENVAFNPDPSTQTEDEFYWDILGGATPQRIDRASGTVTVPSALAPGLDGRSTCFIGAYGDDSRCDVDRSESGGATVFSVAATDLAPDTAWSIVLGFNEGTFTRPHFPEETTLGRFGWIGLLGASALALVVGLFARARWKDEDGRGVVVAQYVPDPEVSPRLAAEIVTVPAQRVLTAEILALAVSGVIRIVQSPTKKKSMHLELLQTHVEGDTEAARSLDRTLGALFPARTPGNVNTMSSSDQKQGTRLSELSETSAATRLGLRAKPADRRPRHVILALAALLAVGGVAALVVAVVLGAVTPTFLLAGVGLAAVLIVLLVLQLPPARLTRAGAEKKEYLEGLEEFIELAEKDRIAYLQSVSGVDRVDVGDDAQMLRVTERLLPWAALFGQEKSWMAELAVRYDSVGQPGWFQGSDGTVNAVLLATMVSRLSSQSSSSLAAASSGSGGGVSGGSGFGGGGFAGGGGGGGFSGGR
ncbi:DUF2207 family protein [Mycetocola reblochoni]|nr:DUF2207 domain-containing protein [Mycetocola reblochoni]